MKKKLIIISICFAFLCGCASENEVSYVIASEPETAVSEVSGEAETQQESGRQEEPGTGGASETKDADETLHSGSITVYICGEVKDPGVYELQEGSRICDAVREAGGLTENADDKSLNQAMKLTDGQQIIVYSTEEAAGGTPMQVQDTGSPGSSAGAKVNLNTADKESLMTLPGIGESRAVEIINYRNEHGRFSSAEDIMNIPGIKEKMYEKIKDYIVI